jgi:uncharacterized protein YbaR (Trm112 family)
MLMNRDFLEMLCCPVDKTPLRVMSLGELADLNEVIAQGDARHASGDPVDSVIEGGLVSSSGAGTYTIADGVPILLPELGIRRAGDASGAPGPAIRRDVDASTDARWDALSRLWSSIQPPLRPGRPGVDVLQRLVAEGCTGQRATRPRALLLGVTPEIATMRWPAGNRLLALDFCSAMIRNVWRAPENEDAMVARADWDAAHPRELPAAASSGRLAGPAPPPDRDGPHRENRQPDVAAADGDP